MLLDVFPSTSNNSEAKDNQLTWDLEEAIFQSVAVCTTMCGGTLDILQAKLFYFDPPWIASASPPQPLSVDEDQWSWLTSDLDTVFILFFLPRLKYQTMEVITYLQAGEFTHFIYYSTVGFSQFLLFMLLCSAGGQLPTQYPLLFWQEQSSFHFHFLETALLIAAKQQ